MRSGFGVRSSQIRPAGVVPDVQEGHDADVDPLEAGRPEQLRQLAGQAAVHQVRVVPRTLSGKKLEVPVKRILSGVPAERAAAKGALADPQALAEYEELAARRQA